ncbi:hypothetical protein EDF81_1764 [Enterobacter sp. BIGb0383]|uniref:hypothetical protein n=1 Tax=unclassified Enterobacter TaxID=2608935 RepID=UPI000F46A87D|nr:MULTISPECIES: hypothetical protein [unclassified Enterobacter]ROP58981.1 hypothetical protein EDF81_1764 [Enterobacter sp. BIGb0383]ROS09553.1 hypothetical protein EC848_3077 [Enterobacter sp. BIGb0359]
MRITCIALLVLASGWAHASEQACDSKRIVTQAWSDAASITDDSIRVADATVTLAAGTPQSVLCKLWPARPELTLAAVPLMTTQADAEGYSTGDLELLVLDSATLQVKQRLRLPNRMDDDAMYISRISLDTARWKVAADQLAFGLRIDKSGSSRVNPFSEKVLSLYVIDNNSLRPVLKGVVAAETGGEWDGSCAGNFSEAARTLSLSETASFGYRDIIVNEKHIDSVFRGDVQNCQSTETKSSASYRLRYDGKQYSVPEKLQPIADE